MRFLLFFTLSIGSFSLVFSQQQQNTRCDLGSKSKEIDVRSYEVPINLDISNLNNETKASYECTWNFTLPIDNSVIEFSRIVLAPTDVLTIVCEKRKINKTATFETIFSVKGSINPGIVVIPVDCYSSLLKITLDEKLKPFFRTFSSIFHYNSTLIQLNKDSGLFAFPLNSPKNSTTLNSDFNLLPSFNQYSDRLVMLKFSQLPSNFSFVLNDKTYNNTNPPLNVPYLQKSIASPLKFKLSSFTGPILINYWLVSEDCSSINKPLKINENVSIPTPNETFRQEQKILHIKCAQYFFTDEANAQFKLQIDSQLSGLVNSGDSVDILKDNGDVVLGIDNPSLMYYRTVDNVLPDKSYLIIYDSPYPSANPNTKYKAPLLKVISSSEAKMIMIDVKDVPVVIKGSKNSVKIIHTIYSKQLNSGSKHVVADFGAASISRGKFSVKIYNSETDQGYDPIVTLENFDRLPTVIPSNFGILRVVFNGVIESDLTVTYRLVDSASSCQFLSTFTSTFEIHGAKDSSFHSAVQPCTWYIPSSIFSHTVINPTVLSIPEGKTLNITTFSKVAPTSSISIKGPLKRFYLEDIFLNASNAYEFTLDNSGIKKDDLHVLIAYKKDYVNETYFLDSKEKTSSIKSINFPGHYPVGLSQKWSFNESNSWALITLNDVNILNGHTFSLFSKQSNVIWNGNVNLTGYPDYLIQEQFVFYFNTTIDPTNATDFTTISDHGFNVDIRYPGEAYDVSLNTSTETKLSFNSSKAIAKKPLSIWRVTLNEKSTSFSDSILRINVSLSESLTKTKANLIIYDSLSLRHSNTHFANGSIDSKTNKGSFVTSIRTALIVYDYSESLNTKTNFSLSFVVTSEKCGNTKNYTTKCHTTDRCITDPMICNGINECGDYTDEIYCNGNRPTPPPPTPPSSSGGVNTLVVIFVLMPLASILGIVGYVYLPILLRRWRNGRYSEFRDLSDVS